MSDMYTHRTWTAVRQHRDSADHLKLIFGDAVEQCEHCLDAVEDLPAGSTRSWVSTVTGERYVGPRVSFRDDAR